MKGYAKYEGRSFLFINEAFSICWSLKMLRCKNGETMGFLAEFGCITRKSRVTTGFVDMMKGRVEGGAWVKFID